MGLRQRLRDDGADEEQDQDRQPRDLRLRRDDPGQRDDQRGDGQRRGKVSTTASIATLGARATVNGAAVGTELVNTAEPIADLSQSFTVSGLTRQYLDVSDNEDSVRNGGHG